MTHAIPEHTTRPLYHIAKWHGVDYTDVLNVAWGFKQAIRGKGGNDVWFRPSMDRIANKNTQAIGAIMDHITHFTALQDRDNPRPVS